MLIKTKLNENDLTLHLIVGLIIKMGYFPPYRHSSNKMEVELYFTNCAAKSDFQNATCVDTLQFSKQDDLVNLKLEVNKLDID